MSECENCPFAADIRALLKSVEKHEQRFEYQETRITELEKQIIVMNERFNNLISGQKEIKEALEEIREKPGKRWDTLSTSVITAIAGGIIGYLINLCF